MRSFTMAHSLVCRKFAASPSVFATATKAMAATPGVSTQVRGFALTQFEKKKRLYHNEWVPAYCQNSDEYPGGLHPIYGMKPGTYGYYRNPRRPAIDPDFWFIPFYFNLFFTAFEVVSACQAEAMWGWLPTVPFIGDGNWPWPFG
ncbi:unnamed protein product [Vitrella brassicaformis CCMP3155]|uniref:Uncharacterized protein n=1 Tax=Vitrella brassicaformis (strain CCMP3155) TaxID=1169540 RepID=A0A0G4F7B5_VITBC|nr:unnamed protein product [Vitrella brassicaformis CCMP3155]|eukprot:CEM08551.1 unnamed protein product [Vitrella brassicaformis CCMP3155]